MGLLIDDDDDDDDVAVVVVFTLLPPHGRVCVTDAMLLLSPLLLGLEIIFHIISSKAIPISPSSYYETDQGQEQQRAVLAKGLPKCFFVQVSSEEVAARTSSLLPKRWHRRPHHPPRSSHIHIVFAP